MSGWIHSCSHTEPSNLCKRQRTASVICVQSARCLRKQPARKGGRRCIKRARHDWMQMLGSIKGFIWTDIDKETENGESCRIIQGCGQIRMDGLHVDDVHLEIKKTNINIRPVSSSSSSSSGSVNTAPSTDRTVPPSGICACPPCARSRWWPGPPSGSAAGWCGKHPEALRRSPTCHSPPAE